MILSHQWCFYLSPSPFLSEINTNTFKKQQLKAGYRFPFISVLLFGMNSPALTARRVPSNRKEDFSRCDTEG
jgi:hypothetical protein